MNKKYIVLIVIGLLLLLSGLFIFFNNKEYKDDENTLYSIKFDNLKLRFERYDYSIGQNQIVGVEISKNKGKTYEKITVEPIIVSMEPKFIFLNQHLGFAISKTNLEKYNDYLGLKVTNDGGKRFIDSKINYENPNIDIITVEDVPYFENNVLKLNCSIYQAKKDNSGYEDIDLIFFSTDNGLTWNLDNKK